MQTAILIFFQHSATPLLDMLGELITMLGEESLMMLVIGWIYWNSSKEAGASLGIVLLFSGLLNVALKLIFRVPRPYLLLDQVAGKRLQTAGGYSFPSGHTQTATTFYFGLALLLPRHHRRWGFTVAVCVSVLVAVSRIYLGVHWPLDVAAGLLLGLLCALLMMLGSERLLRLAAILTPPLFVLSLVIAGLNARQGWALEGMEDSVKAAALLAGLVWGLLGERRLVGFVCGGRFLIRLLRFLIGMAAALLLRGGLKILLPEVYYFDAFRYLIVGGWIAFLFPWLGVGAGLFTRPDSPQAA